MKILVIGGTRFIGPPVVRRLLSLGHDVTLFHRGTTQSRIEGGVREILGDRHDLDSFTNEISRAEPDVVLDMIPLSEKDARCVMHVFAGIARRVVAISSQDVYRAYGRLIGLEPGSPDPTRPDPGSADRIPPDPTPLTETSPLRETWFPYRKQAEGPDDYRYSYDKIPAERIFLASPELPGTILRLPMVYGPGDYQHRLFNYLKRMDDNRRAILLEEGDASWRWTHGYVENVADAIALAVTDDRAAGQVYNVGEEEAPTTQEWIRQIGEAAGWSGRVVICPKDLLPPNLSLGVDPRHDLVVSTSKIRRDLGFKERVWQDEALRRTIDWERANPPEKVDSKEFDYAAEDRVLKELGI